MDLRLRFDEVVYDDHLLGPWFSTLSFAQQSCLLAAYGCDLDDTEKDTHGWTRLDYYWASQGHAEYDDDGYIVGIDRPVEGYLPHPFTEIWVVAGVRGGKSDRIAATAVVYEALFANHEQHIREGKLGYCLQVCQDLRLARESIHGIEATLKAVPFIHTPAPPSHWAGKRGERIGRRTADFIRLWNGMAVMTIPPTVKAIRGYDSPCAVLDEVGIWPTGEDAANVDKEVFSQAKSRQAQFKDTLPKIFGISSPWINSGLLYDRFQVGTKGKNIQCASCTAGRPTDSCPTCVKAREGFQNLLVCHFTTASMGNPLITREWLREQRLQDPQKFRRECLALFDSPAGAFLSSILLDGAVDKGIIERPSAFVLKQGQPLPTHLPVYVAALDAGFRRDAFTFGISHVNHEGKIEIDVLRRWKPRPNNPLNPIDIIKEITPLLKDYKIMVVASDSASFESLNQLCLQHNWCIEKVELSGGHKNDIMGNLKQVLEQRTLRLLDNREALAELKNLQRKVLDTSNVRISAPGGMHDDYAMCIALLANRCVWFLPIKNEAAYKPTLEDLGHQQVARKQQLTLDLLDS